MGAATLSPEVEGRLEPPGGGGGGGRLWTAGGAPLGGGGGGRLFLLLNWGDIGDAGRASSLEKREAPLSMLGLGEDGRGGEATGTGGGGARVTGAASAKESF